SFWVKNGCPPVHFMISAKTASGSSNLPCKPFIKGLAAFALFGVATPSDLIRDSSRTPFNIGRAIELTGFELNAAKPLINGLQGRFEDPEAVLAEIMKWTGGQPFLTQKLCKLALEHAPQANAPLLSISVAQWVAELTRSQIIQNWETHDEPEHLKTIRDRLLGDEKNVSRLLGLTEEIIQYGSIPADDSPEQSKLLLTNLVIKSNNQLVIRNRIYQQIFNLDWIYQQSDKLCPYSREVKLWLDSQGKDSSRLLRGQALQDAQRWANSHSISQPEYQFLNASQEQEQFEIRQKLEFKRLKEIESRLVQEQKLAQTQRFFLSTVGAALAITSILSIAAYRNYQQAKSNEIRAEKNKLAAHVTSAESLFNSEQRFASLVEALRAKQDLTNLPEVDQSLESDIDLALQQAVYNVVEKNTFAGHQDVVNSVSYSFDGKLIASCSSDNSIKIWQRDGKLLKTILGHQDAVIDVAFSPKENILVSASEDNTVKIWNAQGKLKNTLNGHRGSVHRVVFSPQGDLIASASEDKTVRIWNRQGGLVNVLTGHEREVLAVAFTPDGKTIATGDRSGRVRIWNLSGELLRTFWAHALPIRGLDFSPDGQQLVSGGDDNLAKIWQLDGPLIKVLKGYEAPVTGVKFSPDGKLIATSSWDKSIKIWHPDGTLHSNLMGHQGRVWRLAWSGDGSEIATAGWDNTTKIWQLKQPLVKTFYGHTASVLGVAFQPQGELIASSSDDRSVKLWQTDGRIKTNFTGHDAETYEVAFNPTGNMIASSSLDRSVKLWQTDGTMLHTSWAHNAPVKDVAFWSNNTLISGGSDKTIKMWDLQIVSGKLKAVLKQTIFAHQAIITDIDVSANQQLIASVSHDRYLKLWNHQGQLLRSVIADATGLKGVAISPNTQIIATVGKEQNIKLWNRQGKLLTILEGHQAIVLDVEFSPDGSKIASASADRTVKIWNSDGELLTTLRGHQGRVWNVAFSPSGEQLASASEDTTIKLWDLQQILKLDNFQYGCNWIKNYLKTNSETRADNHQLCT
ncbi:MAG: hypothetical protein AAFY16_10115, partial [Cyanobacteria bacterium J06642_3]